MLETQRKAEKAELLATHVRVGLVCEGGVWRCHLLCAVGSETQALLLVRFTCIRCDARAAAPVFLSLLNY